MLQFTPKQYKQMGFKERFDAFVMPIPFSGCFIWTAGTHASGYGVYMKNKKMKRAHIESYKYFVGAVPKGMFVCHKCDTPPCVNPDHLFLGTPKDNHLDMMKKGRHPYKVGEDHDNSLLTNEQVLEIKNTPKYNGSGRYLAKKFNVSDACISAIRNNHHWKHIITEYKNVLI